MISLSIVRRVRKGFPRPRTMSVNPIESDSFVSFVATIKKDLYERSGIGRSGIRFVMASVTLLGVEVIVVGIGECHVRRQCLT